MTDLTKLSASGYCPACERKTRTFERQNMRVCGRCNRAFNLYTGKQMQNFAWQEVAPDVFEDCRVHETKE
jgi:hypothetical protein